MQRDHTTYSSYLFTYRLCPCNLLGIRGCRNQCVCEALHVQLADCRADAQSFHPVRPEELVTEERLNDSWDTR